MGSKALERTVAEGLSLEEVIPTMAQEMGASLEQSTKEFLDLTARNRVASGVARTEQAAATGITASRSYVDVETAIRVVDKFKENPAILTAEEIRILINTDVNAERLNSLEQTVARLSETTQDIRYGFFQDSISNLEQWERLDSEARSLYNVFRTSRNNIEIISRNTGISREIIEKIRNHMFFEEHLLQRGSSEFVLSRFDPDLTQAHSWQRLVDGNFVQSDLRLLLHEYTESVIIERHFNLMGRNLQYSIAHNMANMIHDWQSFVR